MITYAHISRSMYESQVVRFWYGSLSIYLSIYVDIYRGRALRVPLHAPLAEQPPAGCPGGPCGCDIELRAAQPRTEDGVPPAPPPHAAGRLHRHLGSLRGTETPRIALAHAGVVQAQEAPARLPATARHAQEDRARRALIIIIIIEIMITSP